MTRSQRTLTLGSLLLGLASLGSGCGGGADGALGEKPTVTGTVSGWTRGTGYTLNMALSRSKTPGTILGTGTLDASGAFTLTLPGAEVVGPQLPSAEPLVGEGCAAAPTVSPLDLKYGSLSLSAKKTGSPDVRLAFGSTAASGKPSAGDVAVEYVYTEQDGSIVGEIRCEEGASLVGGSANIHLRKGWNTLVSQIKEYSISPTSLRIVTDLYTGPPPAEAKWQPVGSPSS